MQLPGSDKRFGLVPIVNYWLVALNNKRNAGHRFVAEAS